MHADNKKKLLVLSESPTDRLDDATLSAEAKCSINVFKSRNENVSVHYNQSSSFLR